MNIREAKEEVKNTLRAYLAKDETGAYLIPTEKQRPLLLMGPPGIGKTAIMEQIAQEMHINLVSYTITHHTRQSAIGLPVISHKTFGGREYAVTEYTMSEIIASVYERIEESGISEGILFLDEINCVSETLAPTMLQFLQYKTFGGHRVPEGFVIVTAGNPPEYNKSVRDFDIVTLDRVRRIDITEDAAVWREYAVNAGVHGAILAYLAIRPNNFYSMRAEVEGTSFVTARGWEDLSRIMKAYEALGIPVTERLAGEYLKDERIARDFASYYTLYEKYKTQYQIDWILKGHIPEDTDVLSEAPFDEKLSLIGLLNDALSVRFATYVEDFGVQKILYEALGGIRRQLREEPVEAFGYVRRLVEESAEEMSSELEQRIHAHMISTGEKRTRRLAIDAMKELSSELIHETSGTTSAGEIIRSDYSLVRTWFAAREERRAQEIDETSDALTNAFCFLSQTYGENQEMVLFLTELASNKSALSFISDCGNEAYAHYNRLLLVRDNRQALQDRIRESLKL